MIRQQTLHWAFVLLILTTCALVPAAPSVGASPSHPQDTAEARLVSSIEAGVTFDVDVPWDRLHVEPSSSHYVQVSMPGWLTTSRAGEPMLPRMIQIIGVPWGAVLSVRVQPGRAHTVALPAPVLPVATQEVAGELPPGDGDVSALPEPTLLLREDPAVYSGDGEYPGVLAEVANDGVLRQQRVVSIAAYPVQYRPGSQQLTVYESLRVNVNFQRPPAALLQAPAAESAAYENLFRRQLLNYDSAREWRQAVPLTPSPSLQAEPNAPGEGSASVASTPWAPPEPGWRIKVRADGLYKLTYTETLAAGVPVDQPELDPRTFQLYNLGSEVAISVTGESDGRFNPVDYIVFYGQAVASKYTADNVYWLTYDPAGLRMGLRMGTRDGTPAGAATPAYYPAQLHMEKNAYYLAKAPGDDALERWGWTYIYPPTTQPSVTNTFTLTAPYTGGYSATLTVALLGYLVSAANPDHHARITINGTQVADVTWDGLTWAVVDVEISQGLLAAGPNILAVQCFTDTGVSYDVVYLDWERLKYANTFRAEGDVLSFSYPVNGTWRYQVDGFSTNEVAVYDVTSPAAVVQIEGVSAVASSPGYAAQFQDTVAGATSYWAVGSTGYRMVQAIPDMEQDTASDLRSTENDAEHIIIFHTTFLTQTEQLRALRVTQGITRAVAVDVQDIYDEFGYGLVGAGAIHDLVAYAYSNWKRPAPSYVVLFGDGHYDPKNYLGFGRVSYIPPYLAFADPWLGETAVDNRYVAVAGGDTFPDLMLGRLAVNDGVEASAFVNKIAAYEQSPAPGGWKLRVLAVADNGDTAGNFPKASDDLLADYLPTWYDAEEVYLGVTHPVAADARFAVTTTINAGVLIVNYIGHAGESYWADETLFAVADVGPLTNTGKLPVMLPMTCRDGYYQYPQLPSAGKDALAEVVTRADGKGAVASWSPTGLGLSMGHDYLDRGFFDSIFGAGHGHPTLGAATIAGKLNLWGTGGNLDLIDTFLLFGDPATKMPMADPTAVQLLWFDASGQAGGIELGWETASEVDALGFNLYRAVQVDGHRTKINAQLIPSLVAPGGSYGAVYSYQDRGAKPNRTYYYWLEDVDVYGRTGLQGPMSARWVK